MTTARKKIFISSVQKEFAQVRLDLKVFSLKSNVQKRYIAFQ